MPAENTAAYGGSRPSGIETDRRIEVCIQVISIVFKSPFAKTGSRDPFQVKGLCHISTEQI